MLGILAVLMLFLSFNCASSTVLAQVKTGSEFARIIEGFLSKEFRPEWPAVDKLPLVRWAPLPPTQLQNCLPDGNCFARQGTASIEGRNIAAVAAGARTIPMSLYLRNTSIPFGETAVLTALRDSSFTVDLARCPVPGQRGGTNWYRLRSARSNAGVLSVQTSCNGAACEGFVISQGETLPALQPNQVSLYSEQCGATENRKPVSTLLPHQRLAQAFAALIPSASDAPLYDWKTLAALKSDVQWSGQEPKKVDLSFMGDPNPFSLSGSVTYAGRQFSPLASGSQTQVQAVHFEENGLHPRGEDVLAEFRSLGFTLQLVRCGPVYTDSTTNWYRLTSTTKRVVMLKQSIRREGTRVQDSYTLRLDATLPPREAAARDPGVGDCR